LPIKAINIVFGAPRAWLPAITSEENRISGEGPVWMAMATAPSSLTRYFRALIVVIPGFSETASVTLST
jgi:hypothetical protein